LVCGMREWIVSEQATFMGVPGGHPAIAAEEREKTAVIRMKRTFFICTTS